MKLINVPIKDFDHPSLLCIHRSRPDDYFNLEVTVLLYEWFEGKSASCSDAVSAVVIAKLYEVTAV